VAEVLEDPAYGTSGRDYDRIAVAHQAFLVLVERK